LVTAIKDPRIPEMKKTSMTPKKGLEVRNLIKVPNIL
jgi:hypothetical protein